MKVILNGEVSESDEQRNVNIKEVEINIHLSISVPSSNVVLKVILINE